MKLLPAFFLSSATTVFLAACTGPTPPVVIEPTTFDLSITVAGVPGAPVKVLNAAGETKFSDTVTGSKTLSALPKGKYTVTGGAVANFAAPAPVVADLSSANAMATLAYTASAGQALALDRIQGTLSDPLAKGNKIGVLLQNSVLASVVVGSDGSVNLPLVTPPVAEMFPFLPGAGSNCTYTGSGTGSGSANAGKVFFTTDLVVYSAQGDVIGTVTETPVGGTAAASLIHAYADSAQSYQGTVKCVTPSSTYSYQVNVQMAAGWNALIADKGASGDFSIVTAPSGTRVQLNLNTLLSAVEVLLDTSALTLKAGESVTTNATIYQVGGISGKLDLSTDVPGVSVEPASVTLPVLGTQSARGRSLFDTLALTSHGLRPLKVGTQRLTTTLTFKAAADASGFNGTMNLLASQGGKQVGQTGVGLNLNVTGVQGRIDYPNPVVLERGTTQTLNVNLYAQGGYSGPVTLSFKDLPTGLTATSSTVAVNGYASGTLDLTAAPTAPTGAQILKLVVDANGRQIITDVNLNIPAPSLIISAQPLTLYAGEQAGLQVTLTPVSGFSGTLDLTLDTLPQGVTQVRPVSVDVTGTLALTIPLQAAAGSETAQTLANISAVSGSSAFKQTVKVQIYPQRFVLPTDSYTDGSAIDQAGNLWVSGHASGSYGHKQYYKVASSGIVLAYDNASSGCGDLTSGDDGNVWDSGPPYIRLNVNDGTTTQFYDPRGISGCGLPAKIDANGRAWDSTWGQLVRLDLVNQKSEAVSVNNPNLLDIDGRNIWVGSGSSLVKVDAETLQTQSYTVAGISVFYGMVARGSTLWIPTAGINGNQIASYDTSSGITKFFDVVKPASVKSGDKTLLGIDGSGRFWFQYIDYISNTSTWVLFDPATKTNVKVIPAIRDGGSDSRVRVLPGGDLWVQIGNSVIFVKI